jgi:hypothetical protein
VTLPDAVEAFLRDDGWPATRVGDGVWFTAVQGSSGRWQVSFEIRPRDVLVVRSHSPMNVPAANRAAVVDYAARATYGLSIGVVEVAVDDGQAAVRTALDAREVPPEALPKLVSATAYINVQLAARYLPGLLAVALGGVDPVSALPPDERAMYEP